MTKRSSVIDDKLIYEMILTNIANSSQMNIEVTNILNEQQIQILSAYEQKYNYQPYLSFFLSLGVMSHLSQNSFYTHYASSDRWPVQLYLWLLGSSGMSVSSYDEKFRVLSRFTLQPYDSIRSQCYLYSGESMSIIGEINRFLCNSKF